MPLFVMGRGSNLVVSDRGWDGAVVVLGQNLSGAAWAGNRARVQAGTRLTEFVMDAVGRGLSGIEKLAGIPGSVGGAVFMNAGAYGQEFGQCVASVEALSCKGEARVFLPEECGFGYRTSAFRLAGWIVLAAEVELMPADPETLRRSVKEIQAARRDKQPLELPNAGSLFKRPPNGFASKMVDEAGLRGFRVGDAAISEKHAGFAVNLGHATAQQVWDLSCEVIRRIEASHGVTLEREVVFLGRFD
jgi:UDP-N-acetylmuramate dehydrogenase